MYLEKVVRQVLKDRVQREVAESSVLSEAMVRVVDERLDVVVRAQILDLGLLAHDGHTDHLPQTLRYERLQILPILVLLSIIK